MNSQADQNSTHAVAIIGGATAGAAVASRLADAGAQVFVFEMNQRPFGKIEDGLPRWHVALRNKEFATITEKLSRPNVHFVPNTRVGEDVGFDELAKEWGFSAVVLANGAWRDRSVPVKGAEDYVGKGLIYQNPFIIAFNHQEDAAYKGPTFESLDNAIVLGGGLASLDVAKVLMMETTIRALKERGHEVHDVEEMEKKGIPRTLEEFGLKWSDLGLKGCTLYYRRRPDDMPLMATPPDATPERMVKVEASRRKILDKAMEKFCFHFEGLSTPEELIVEDGRLTGFVFRRVRQENGKLIPTDETYEGRGSMIVSSIGSIPEPIRGITMKGELFPFEDWDLGRLQGYDNVFSAGNVVTGKGNIVASRKHADHVAEELVEKFLGLKQDGRADAEAAMFSGVQEAAEQRAEAVAQAVKKLPKVSAATLTQIEEKFSKLQSRVAYSGTLSDWLGKLS